MKSSKSTNRAAQGNQDRPKQLARKSSHGGTRPGAGRKPGSRNRPHNDDLYEPCCQALAKALDGSQPLQFVLAMMMLGADPEDTRAGLGLSRDQFTERYGSAIRDFSGRLNQPRRVG